MATRQSVGRWAAVVAALFLLWVPGLDSKGSEPIPKEITIQIGEKVSMKLALIPAGKFMMGEENNSHKVTISKPFYVGVTEVTQAQYEAIMGTNPGDFKGATNPVELVSWNDATDFFKKLSEKTRQAVRLPTEAEWEYACRAGSKTQFCFGDADEGLGDYAWYDANSGKTTHPVGQKKPNAWGLFDMHGNVWEWCADWYGDYPKNWYGDYPLGAVTDPFGPASGESRVLRGGYWDGDPNDCRSASRNYIITPDGRSYFCGFRVVVSVPGSPAAAAPVAAHPAPAAPTAAAPAELTLDLGGGVSMKLVLIPVGKFMMGEEKDPVLVFLFTHEVTISKPFYMGATEVTQAQYQAIMGTNPSNFKGATNPVDSVSWNDAADFCKKLSEKTRQAVRLPTEAEWEYACRAGSKTGFSFGDAEEALGDYAWYRANSGDTTHPVGQKKPNAWGLYDMHGNLYEWCANWYGDYPKGALTDPQDPASGKERVLRGGSWSHGPDNCRAAYRYRITPDFRYINFGFRVVVSVSAPPDTPATTSLRRWPR